MPVCMAWEFNFLLFACLRGENIYHYHASGAAPEKEKIHKMDMDFAFTRAPRQVHQFSAVPARLQILPYSRSGMSPFSGGTFK